MATGFTDSLRKSTVIAPGKQPVKFNDGHAASIPTDVAKKAMTKLNAIKDPQARAGTANKMNASLKSFKKIVNESAIYGKEYPHEHVMSRIKNGDWEAHQDVEPGKTIEITDRTKNKNERTSIRVGHVKEEEMNEALEDGHYVVNHMGKVVGKHKDSNAAVRQANREEDRTSRVHAVHKVKDGKVEKSWHFSDSQQRYAPHQDYKGENAHHLMHESEEMNLDEAATDYGGDFHHFMSVDDLGNDRHVIVHKKTGHAWYPHIHGMGDHYHPSALNPWMERNEGHKITKEIKDAHDKYNGRKDHIHNVQWALNKHSSYKFKHVGSVSGVTPAHAGGALRKAHGSKTIAERKKMMESANLNERREYDADELQDMKSGKKQKKQFKLQAKSRRQEKYNFEDLNEESEDLQEVSDETLRKYKKAALADIASRKKPGRVSKETVAKNAKRTSGIEKANAIQTKRSDERLEKREKDHDEAIAHVRSKAPGTLLKHGYSLASSSAKHDLYIKAHPEHGVVTHVKLHKSEGNPYSSKHHIATFGSTTGWQGSDDRHNVQYGWRGDEKTKDDHHAEFEKKIVDHEEYHKRKALEEATKVVGNVLTEEEIAGLMEADGETIEHLDEVSKALLGRYIDRANEHNFQANLKKKDYLHGPTPPSVIKRRDNINLATAKSSPDGVYKRKVYDDKPTPGKMVYGHKVVKTIAKVLAKESLSEEDIELLNSVTLAEANQLDEVSRAKLGDYIKAASFDKSNRAHNVGEVNGIALTTGTNSDERAHRDAESKKHLKRSSGIQTAVDKLTGDKYTKVHAREEFDGEFVTASLSSGYGRDRALEAAAMKVASFRKEAE